MASMTRRGTICILGGSLGPVRLAFGTQRGAHRRVSWITSAVYCSTHVACHWQTTHWRARDYSTYRAGCSCLGRAKIADAYPAEQSAVHACATPRRGLMFNGKGRIRKVVVCWMENSSARWARWRASQYTRHVFHEPILVVCVRQKGQWLGALFPWPIRHWTAVGRGMRRDAGPFDGHPCSRPLPTPPLLARSGTKSVAAINPPRRRQGTGPPRLGSRPMEGTVLRVSRRRSRVGEVTRGKTKQKSFLAQNLASNSDLLVLNHLARKPCDAAIFTHQSPYNFKL